MERKNSIGIFPTRYGKSVCFQMVPLIHDAIYGGKHIGLVISPLKSLSLVLVLKVVLLQTGLSMAKAC
jgi:superfamily II DNA helicase RecQ